MTSSLTRYTGLLSLLSALIFSLSMTVGSLAQAANTSQPNVIVIMTDDQGSNLGYLGNPHIKTPHIDKLASESIRMTNSTKRINATSRAALMTGKVFPYRRCTQ